MISSHYSINELLNVLNFKHIYFYFRYVTRRPVRTRLLAERARQVAAERAAYTTDDDNASELKFGKFVPRPDRKLQLELARERKAKREESRGRIKSPKAELPVTPELVPRDTEPNGIKRRDTLRSTTIADKRLSLQEENMKSAQNEILVSVMTV